MDTDPELWKRRPLPENLLSYARDDVVCLYRAIQQMWKVAVPNNVRNNEIEKHLLVGKDIKQIANLFAASSTNRKTAVYQSPENAKEREFAFHPSEKNRMISKEVFDCMFPEKINSSGIKMELHDDLNSLLKLIPAQFIDLLSNQTSDKNLNIETLRDIVLEVGRRPYAYFGSGQREWLCTNPELKIDLEGMQRILLPLEDKFGLDNRAGIDGSLHRISCMRDKKRQNYSLTYRVGRAFVGNTNLIQDVLEIGDKISESSSILILELQEVVKLQS